MLLQYAVDMAIIAEHSNVTKPIPLNLQVNVMYYRFNNIKKKLILVTSLNGNRMYIEVYVWHS